MEEFDKAKVIEEESQVTLNSEYKGWEWLEPRWKSKRDRPSLILRVPIGLIRGEPARIFHKLGMVKQKNDGRWEWFCFKQRDFHRDYNNGDTTQGVAKTKEEAMTIVERGMNLPTQTTESKEASLAPA